VAVIGKHYGRCCIKSDSDEQLRRVFGSGAGTFAGTLARLEQSAETQVGKKVKGKKWSGRVDLNPTGKKGQGTK
jgi:hypothetical protein